MRELPPLEHLEETIGYRFADRSLLEEALTHRSFAHEAAVPRPPDNQRLEHLGDAVVGLVVVEHLFRTRPRDAEGDLADAKSDLVRKQALADAARAWGLDLHLRLGRGEELTGGREREKNLEDAFEAVVGAVFLDGGLEAARGVLASWLAAAESAPEVDPKTRILHEVQARWRVEPTYTELDRSGPDHAREFLMAVRAGDQELGRGRGRSKKEASRAAAREALARLAEEE